MVASSIPGLVCPCVSMLQAEDGRPGMLGQVRPKCSYSAWVSTRGVVWQVGGSCTQYIPHIAVW